MRWLLVYISILAVLFAGGAFDWKVEHPEVYTEESLQEGINASERFISDFVCQGVEETKLYNATLEKTWHGLTTEGEDEYFVTLSFGDSNNLKDCVYGLNYETPDHKLVETYGIRLDNRHCHNLNNLAAIFPDGGIITGLLCFTE